MGRKSKDAKLPGLLPPGLTRRGFLKGAGVSAATTVLLDTAIVEMAEAQQAKAENDGAVGPGEVKVTLSINGQDKPVTVLPSTTLAEVLRDGLEMTGTKVVCDRGACSACTVMLDGVTVCSCMTLAVDVGGRKVTTVEGLAQGDTLHPVQEAFVENDALQCGFCTPGMVMSCASLLQHNPNPTTDDVRHACAGNLCRCGTYPKVFAAALEAAKKTKNA